MANTVVKTALSKREMDIVRLAASGLSNCEVGQRLSLSESTVKNYLVRVYEKLGISTRIELILYVLGGDQNPESEENEITEETRRGRRCYVAQAQARAALLRPAGSHRKRVKGAC